ncbi:MAG: hypothetical protein HY207_02425 [Nitrospirae bacterium]|nr:hypothetical protein [Nitrospirota bacterium]
MPKRPKNGFAAFKLPRKSLPIVLGEFDQICDKFPVHFPLRGDQSVDIVQ